ncbi:DUF4303 domain-containing protein [Gemella sp. GH3]|uniref:DUF4303 domain-containing protein n=1 Tax=unclassified Gemella TaxID=2624949 RepID=UPI0015D0B205|nr:MULTISPECIES: DUF4303 domain-containing protein [unclassified Gemella]MBF0713856.1 DUF4303 domain-containing protein [Gemella sp. GH3.1]NYS50808.1 DUF4303 domain-containing protein [Gemella sp. GH3]
MDIELFEEFSEKCSKELPNEIDKILQNVKGEKACAISFITTDDFYGFYLAWNCSTDIDEYYAWENGSSPDFLYQPLVDIVEAVEELDFFESSDEKWNFAEKLLFILEKNIKEIPEKIFKKNGFKREDILFFATMGDGDYIKEMLEVSAKMFNSKKTLEAYGLIK